LNWDWKRYYNEVISSIGVISIIFLFIKLIVNTFNLEIELLKIYIFDALFIFLNYHLFPKIIKNFRDRRKLFYAVVVVDSTVLFTLINTIFTILNFQETKLRVIFGYMLPLVFTAFVIAYIVVYFTQTAYYKRVNQKLNEYKQKNDDDNMPK